MINVLMIGVDKNRIGGMWTVAETYLQDSKFNNDVRLYYVATSTCGSLLKRLAKMINGYCIILWHLIFHSIDITHVHMAERGSVYRKGLILPVSRFFGAKIIVHLHAGPFVAWYETLNRKQQSRIKHVLSNADKLLVLGSFWEKELKRIIKTTPIEVLYNGISVPSENPYNTRAKNIVFFGVLKKEKGVFDLIDAVKIVDKFLGPEVKVQICGSELGENVSAYSLSVEMEKRIEFLGWVNHEQKNDLLKNAAISVLPSYFEGLSLSVIEAMAYGVPMLTTDVSTMREVLGDSITLIKPGDVEMLAEKIIYLMDNERVRRQWSGIEYERASIIFSKDKMIEKTLKIYHDTLN